MSFSSHKNSVLYKRIKKNEVLNSVVFFFTYIVMFVTTELCHLSKDFIKLFEMICFQIGAL